MVAVVLSGTSHSSIKTIENFDTRKMKPDIKLSAVSWIGEKIIDVAPLRVC